MESARLTEKLGLYSRQTIHELSLLTVTNAATTALALCRERKLTRLLVWEQRDGGQRIIGLLVLEEIAGMLVARVPNQAPRLTPSRPFRTIGQRR